MPESTALAGSPSAQTTQGASGQTTTEPTTITQPTAEGEIATPVATPPPATEPERTYTKAELDAAAAQARREAEAKIKRDKAEKDGEFQTLYQEEQSKAAQLALSLLSRDICDELDIPKDWRDSVVGDSEESLRASAEALKTRLDKMIQDAIKNQKGQAPGTPPPTTESGKTDAQKAQEGREKTKKLVNQAMFGIKLTD